MAVTNGMNGLLVDPETKHCASLQKLNIEYPEGNVDVTAYQIPAVVWCNDMGGTYCTSLINQTKGLGEPPESGSRWECWYGEQEMLTISNYEQQSAQCALIYAIDMTSPYR